LISRFTPTLFLPKTLKQNKTQEGPTPRVLSS